MSGNPRGRLNNEDYPGGTNWSYNPNNKNDDWGQDRFTRNLVKKIWEKNSYTNCQYAHWFIYI